MKFIQRVRGIFGKKLVIFLDDLCDIADVNYVLNQHFDCYWLEVQNASQLYCYCHNEIIKAARKINLSDDSKKAVSIYCL